MKNFLQTKKTLSRHTHKTDTRIRVVLILAIAVLLLLFLRNLVGTAASFVTMPVYTLKHYLETSAATVPTYLRDRAALIEEKRTLEAQLAAEQGTALTLMQLSAENEELRSMLNASGTERIAAGIIARPPYAPYDTLVLDRGGDAGIREHAPVLYGSGLAIGFVRSVTADNAFVTLFSSPGVETTVYIFGPNIFARAYGEGGGVMRIIVPQGIALAQGNLVVLPSLDGGVFGAIDAIESTPTDPEQHAFVTLGAPIASLRLVSVGTQPIDPMDFSEAQKVVDAVAQTLFTFPTPELQSTENGTSSPTTTVRTASSTP
jgi:cell shape-determining protein MreC